MAAGLTAGPGIAFQPDRRKKQASRRGDHMLFPGCACCIGGRPLMAGSRLFNRRRVLGAGFAAAAATALRSEPVAAQGGPPVTIYPAKSLITMDAATEGASAIAVEGERIIAIGTKSGLQAQFKDRATKIDDRFARKVAMTGLIEQHLHPVLSALFMSMAVIAIEDWELPAKTWPAAKSPEDYQAKLKAAVAAGAPDQIFFTFGYHQLWHGPLSRALLDQISPERPVVVWHRSCHEMYFNSKALAALGVSEAQFQGKGAASNQLDWAKGHFYEEGLFLIMPMLAPVIYSPQMLGAGLQQLVRYIHQSGIVALNEPGAQIDANGLKTYQAVLGAEATPFDTTLIVDGRAAFKKHREKALAATEALMALAPAGKVRFLNKQIKLFADGAIVSQLMQMKGGYLDGHHGEWMMPPDDLAAAFKLYWDAGYQIHTHVTGDAGLELVLEQLESRMADNPRTDHRSIIVHFANSDESQIPRIHKVGAWVSGNPYYVTAFADRYAEFGLGPERADSMVRLGSVVREGIPFSLHSDMPIGPAKPLFNAWAAVTRLTSGGRVAAPGQRVAVELALRAITIEAARSWRMEDDLGSITAGKLANLTILEEDPRRTGPDSIKDIPIWGTMYRGRVAPLQ